jgi:alpha-D-xyloside xylohydrolase
LTLPDGKGQLIVQPCTDRIVRVLFAPGAEPPSHNSLIARQEWGPVEYRVERRDGAVSVFTKALRVDIDTETGCVEYADPQGRVILREGRGGRRAEPCKILGEPALRVRQMFVLADDEGLYGLGQYQTGVMNYRGHDVLLVQANREVAIPFLVSTKGYGILWDNYSHTEFHDGPEDMYLQSEVADAVDYYFIAGDTMDDVIAGYREITGAAPMYGRWAYGYWQCKERYKSFDELKEVVDGYRSRGLPLDNIVQDWRYWGEREQWSSMEFDPQTYPDPVRHIRELHERNVHLMISIWPVLGAKTKIHQDMESRSFLYPVVYAGLGGRTYDPFNPEARRLYWDYAKRGLFDKGVDAWWMDATEPEVTTGITQAETERNILDCKRTALGPIAKYLNAYSLMSTKGCYEGQREATNDKRVFILTRSSFAGQQKYAATTWSGDISATWDVFRAQVPAGINFCMAGVPYWTTDIGAFFINRERGAVFPDGVQDPAYCEFYTRWFQYGAWCPIFRSHGTGTPREVWRFGEPGSPMYESQAKFLRLRYRLLPYIYSLAWKVTNDGYTMMRGLPMDFGGDRNVHGLGEQYMFGPAFMVRPVLEAMYFQPAPTTSAPATTAPTSSPTTAKTEPVLKPVVKVLPKGVDTLVAVYLPKGAAWYDFWTGKHYDGGQTIQTSAPIDVMPLYARAGSIVPLGPVMQYATEKPADPLELRIYPGADGRFVLYEDENDNYNYERGVHAEIAFEWNDATGRLAIGERQGSFPGMLAKRVFHVVLVRPGTGVGAETTEKPDQVVNYDGQAVSVSCR